MHESDKPMYLASAEEARQHRLFANGLDQGVPVLMTDCGRHFEEQPFSAEAMYAQAKKVWNANAESPVNPSPPPPPPPLQQSKYCFIAGQEKWEQH